MTKEPVMGLAVDLGSVAFESDWPTLISELQRHSRHSFWKNAPPMKVRAELMGQRIIHRFDAGEFTALEFYRQILEFFEINPTRVSYREFRRIWGSINKLNIPFTRLLREIREQVHPSMVIASNTQELHWESIVQRYHAEVVSLFDSFVLSYSIGASKPDPRFYVECGLRLGLEFPSIVFVDDKEENGRAFERLGGQFIQYDIRGHLAGEKALRKWFGIEVPGEEQNESEAVRYEC